MSTGISASGVSRSTFRRRGSSRPIQRSVFHIYLTVSGGNIIKAFKQCVFVLRVHPNEQRSLCSRGRFAPMVLCFSRVLVGLDMLDS